MDTQSTALATREQLNEIAQHDPATAWLYTGGKRLSINNDTRNGFVIKSGGSAVEELSELRALIGSLVPLNSHKQPGDRPQDKGKPRHADNTEWCESRDGKHTSTNGISCEGCPAYGECKWKIELEMILADREEQYLLTIPTASAIRFKQAAQKLAQIHKRHFSQALWRMWVTVEKSNGNSFPVVNYQVFDLDSGEELSLDGTLNGPAKPALPSPAKPATPEVPVKTLNVAKGFDLDGFRSTLILDCPHYADAQGRPNPYHIVKAILKLGFDHLDQGNANEVLWALKEHAAQTQAESK